MKTSSLAALHAERRALVKELERTEQIGVTCQTEIDALLETAALDDPKVAVKLSELRTRSELVPAKIRQLEAKIASLEAEKFRPAILRTVRQLNALGRAEQAAATSQIEKAVTNFIAPGQKPMVDGIVSQILYSSSIFLERIAWLNISITRKYDGPEVDCDYVATELLALAAKQNIDLDALPQPPEPPAIVVEEPEASSEGDESADELAEADQS